MQSHGSLKQPLRAIINSIGFSRHSSDLRKRAASGISVYNQGEQQYFSVPKHLDDHIDSSRNAGERPSKSLSPSPQAYSSAPPITSRCSAIEVPLFPGGSRTYSVESIPASNGFEKRYEDQTQRVDSLVRESDGTVKVNKMDQKKGRASPISSSGVSKRFTVKTDLSSVSSDEKAGGLESRPHNSKNSKWSHAAARQAMLKQQRRRALLDSRYSIQNANEWNLIVKLLLKATLRGEVHYRKTLQSFDLPKGLHGQFNGNTGASLQEILQRTGCSVQKILQSNQDVEGSFQSLSLFGTPTQNASAFKILPEYVELVAMADSNSIASWSDVTLRNHAAPLSSGGLGTLLRQTTTTEDHNTEQDSGSGNEDLSDDDLATLNESMNEILAETTYAKLRAVWSKPVPSTSRDWSLASTGFPHSPEQWTSANLLQYVEDLTLSVPLVRKMICNKERNISQSRVSFVVTELENLFSKSAVMSVATMQAVNVALSFLVKQSQMRVIQRIFASLEQSNFTLSASNFGLMLAAAARTGDAFNFRYTLQVMLRYGVKPTAEIWVELHRLAFSHSAKRATTVVNTLRRVGILADKGAALELIKTSISHEFAFRLDQGWSLARFLKDFDKNRAHFYGRDPGSWMRIDVLNRMLHILLLRERTQDANMLLAEFRRRSKREELSTSTMNILLTPHLHKGDIRSAISTARLLTPDIKPDEVTFKILFDLAWRKRYFNTSRVIWRYACAHGHVTYSMKSLVHRSMRRFPTIHNPTLTRNDLWTAWAGKFVIDAADGLNYHHRSSPETDPSKYLDIIEQTVAEEYKFSGLPSDALSQELIRFSDPAQFPRSTPEYKARHDRLCELLEADLAEAMNLIPVLPFQDMLERAWRKDLEWKRRGLGLPKGLSGMEDQVKMFEEMMREGIRVPMTPGSALVLRRSRGMR